MERRAASLGGGPVGRGHRRGRGQDDWLLLLEPQARELRDDRREAGGIALEREQADAGEGLLDPGRVDPRALGAQDPLGGGGLWVFVRVEELLVELLARPPADDLDRDVAPGLEARQTDHVLGQL